MRPTFFYTYVVLSSVIIHKKPSYSLCVLPIGNTAYFLDFACAIFYNKSTDDHQNTPV